MFNAVDDPKKDCWKKGLLIVYDFIANRPQPCVALFGLVSSFLSFIIWVDNFWGDRCGFDSQSQQDQVIELEDLLSKKEKQVVNIYLLQPLLLKESRKLMDFPLETCDDMPYGKRSMSFEACSANAHIVGVAFDDSAWC